MFQLPTYAPDLNPVEGIWSVLKRGVLANLAVASFAHLVPGHAARPVENPGPAPALSNAATENACGSALRTLRTAST